MDASQRALKLILEGLGVGSDISSVSRRKTVQKATYLVQAAGVDLGYRYNWYVMGPYSPALTRDYYALAEALAVDEGDSANYALQDAVAAKVAEVSRLLNVPRDVNLGQAEWAELVASLHFLVEKRGLSKDDARAVIDREKSKLAPYFDQGARELEEVLSLT